MIYNPNLLLVLSSSSFIVTSMYGLYKKNELCRIDFISALASMMYWMDPNSRNKRAIDIFLANFACVSFLLHGHKYLTPHQKFVGYTSFCYMISFFTLSCITYNMKCKKWYYFHFLFHTFVFGNKLIVYNSKQ